MTMNLTLIEGDWEEPEEPEEPQYQKTVVGQFEFRKNTRA